MDNEKETLVKEIVGELTEPVTKAVVEEFKNNKPLRKDIFGGDKNTKAEKAEQKQKAVDFLKAVYNRDTAQVKALSAGTNADGGFIVPTYISNEIIRLAPNFGKFRKSAFIFDMAGKQKVSIPTASGVVAYRVAEKGKITSSQPTFGQVNLGLQKLATLIPLSNELLRSATLSVVDLLAKLSAEAIAKKEDEWGFLGLSSGEGIFQNASAQVVTMDSGDTTYAKINADYLLDVVSKLDEDALDGAKWYMSLSVFNALRKTKDSQNRYIVQEPAGGMPAMIWNIPVEFTSTMPKTSGSSQAGKAFVALANLNYAVVGDGKEYEIKISDEASVTDTDGTTNINLFEQDMSAVRVIERVDIQFAEASKALVMLKTAAS